MKISVKLPELFWSKIQLWKNFPIFWQDRLISHHMMVKLLSLIWYIPALLMTIYSSTVGQPELFFETRISHLVSIFGVHYSYLEILSSWNFPRMGFDIGCFLDPWSLFVVYLWFTSNSDISTSNTEPGVCLSVARPWIGDVCSGLLKVIDIQTKPSWHVVTIF